MNGIYELVLSVEPLKTIEAHRKTTILMCQQTTECALFIRDYASRSFSMYYSVSKPLMLLTLLHSTANRMVASPINGYTSKATLYLETFIKLKSDFLTESAVVTEIAVFQISTKTDELLSDIKGLCELNYHD
jgi:hypothetical protein